MIRSLKLALLVVAAAILLPSAALAASVTGPSPALTVSATVVAKCTITSGTISFGNLDLTANPTSAITASGSFSVTCTRSATGVNYQLVLSSSNLSGTTWNMKNGTLSLPYTIAVNGSPFVAATPINFTSSGKATPSTFNVAATIPAGNYDLVPGLYSDTINAEVQL